jgi:hypothetical protein
MGEVGAHGRMDLLQSRVQELWDAIEAERACADSASPASALTLKLRRERAETLLHKALGSLLFQSIADHEGETVVNDIFMKFRREPRSTFNDAAHAAFSLRKVLKWRVSSLFTRRAKRAATFVSIEDLVPEAIDSRRWQGPPEVGSEGSPWNVSVEAEDTDPLDEAERALDAALDALLAAMIEQGEADAARKHHAFVQRYRHRRTAQEILSNVEGFAYSSANQIDQSALRYRRSARSVLGKARLAPSDAAVISNLLSHVDEQTAASRLYWERLSPAEQAAAPSALEHACDQVRTTAKIEAPERMQRLFEEKFVRGRPPDEILAIVYPGERFASLASAKANRVHKPSARFLKHLISVLETQKEQFDEQELRILRKLLLGAGDEP